jgi:hypothetical protein
MILLSLFAIYAEAIPKLSAISMIFTVPLGLVTEWVKSRFLSKNEMVNSATLPPPFLVSFKQRERERERTLELKHR